MACYLHAARQPPHAQHDAAPPPQLQASARPAGARADHDGGGAHPASISRLPDPAEIMGRAPLACAHSRPARRSSRAHPFVGRQAHGDGTTARGRAGVVVGRARLRRPTGPWGWLPGLELGSHGEPAGTGLRAPALARGSPRAVGPSSGRPPVDTWCERAPGAGCVAAAAPAREVHGTVIALTRCERVEGERPGAGLTGRRGCGRRGW